MSYLNASAVILCAGNSSRFGIGVKKQWLRIGDLPLWAYVASKFETLGFAQIIVVGGEDELRYMKKFGNYEFIAGGDTRQQSLNNALQIVNTDFICSTDAARACIDEEIIKALFAAKDEADCIIPTVKAQDTTLLNGEMLDRNALSLVQTPQLSKSSILRQALDKGIEFTDDSTAIKAIGGSVKEIVGSKDALKLTSLQDLRFLTCLSTPNGDTFVGYGIDTHAFEQDKPMKLGGIDIPSSFGFKAHSDGDVLIHSIIDAILGAAGAGDIGEWFPDTDMKYKNANSLELLKVINQKIRGFGFDIVNIDATILLEAPKLKKYKHEIANSIAKALDLKPYKVNIKATTSEELGFVGQKLGATVHAVASLKFYDWKKVCGY